MTEETAPEDAEKLSEKFYLISIRVLAIASFATSVFACFTAHHQITVNEHPYVSGIFDIHCHDLNGTSAEFCEGSLLTRYYTLWRSFDSFFSLTDWDSGVLCGDRTFPVPVEGDIALITKENLGHCTDAVAMACAATTILACCFAAYLTVYITVFMASFHNAIFYLILAGIASSAVATVTFASQIDPLRLDSTFCDEQTLFSHCEQERGVGFWFQVATFTMFFLILSLALAWKFSSPPPPPQSHDDLPPFYKTLHFYVGVVRFAELAILLVGVVSPFTRVATAIPQNPQTDTNDLLDHAFSGKGGQMETEINLWQGLFCHPFGARLFLWSVVLNEVHLHEEESFGECEFKDLFECQMGYIMAMVTSITALAFQKDAKTMPLAYMFGFIMHFLSMVKLSWAIGAFMTKVYPGRKEIDPSYCSVWTSYVGENSECSIEIGQGLILTAAALVSVILSFVGEVIVQNHEMYGVGTAFRTLTGRVREGRIADLGKATSERELDVGDDGDHDTDQPSPSDQELGAGGDDVPPPSP